MVTGLGGRRAWVVVRTNIWHCAWRNAIPPVVQPTILWATGAKWGGGRAMGLAAARGAGGSPESL